MQSTPSHFARRQRHAITLLIALLALATARTVVAQYTPSAAVALRWRYIGPVGNRVSSVSGVVGDPNTYYAGAASGGLWKTTDGGVHWDPIFDTQAVHSVGALAVSTSNPNTVWAGTGEPWIRSHISVGDDEDADHFCLRSRCRRRTVTPSISARLWASSRAIMTER